MEFKLQKLNRGYKPCNGKAEHTDPKGVTSAQLTGKSALVTFQSCKRIAGAGPGTIPLISPHPIRK